MMLYNCFVRCCHFFSVSQNGKVTVLLLLLTASSGGLFGQMTSATDTTNGSASLFNESSYTQIVRQGLDPDNSNELYAISYKSSLDSTYSLKKVYLDMGFTQLLNKCFYKNNLLEGPFSGYANGALVLQENYKTGKLDGERLTYKNNQILQRSYFTAGIKTGTWEDYNEQGQLKRKTVYDQRGYAISEQNF